MKLNFKTILIALVLAIFPFNNSWAYSDWTSSNHANSSTSNNIWRVEVKAGQYLFFNWSVSSEEGDYLAVMVNGTAVLRKSGKDSGSYGYKATEDETVIIVASYAKDAYDSDLDDCATVSHVCVVDGENYITAYFKGTGQAMDTIRLPRAGVLGAEALKIRSNLKDFKALCIIGSFDTYDWHSLKEMTSLEYLDISQVQCGSYPEEANTSVKAVNLSEYINTMTGNPFESKNIEYIYVPDNVRTLEGKMHESSSALTLDGCKGVREIGDNSFAGSGLTGVLNLPSLTTLGHYAFAGCKKLLGFSAEKLEVVPRFAFVASGVQYVDLPNVTNIEQEAFSVMTVTNSSTSQKYVGTPALVRVNAPNLSVVGAYAFYGQQMLKVATLSNLTEISNYAFYNVGFGEVNIPNVTSIGAFAFFACSSITSLNADRVLSIGNMAFQNCTSLKNISIAKATAVGKNCFESCHNLLSADLPQVVELEERAFNGCTSLKSVSLSDKLTNIGELCFYGCVNLETVTLPASITLLNSNCFSGSNNIKTIYCNAPAPPAVGETPFTMQTIYSATLYVPTASISLYKTNDYWRHFSYFESNPDVLTDLIVGSIMDLGEVRVDKINLVLKPGGCMSMSGTEAQDFRSVTINAQNNLAGMFISNCERITSDDTKLEYNMEGSKWYYICLPFDVALSNVTLSNKDALYAIYKYDGAKRASSGLGYAWTRIEDGVLNAYRGYIIQLSAASLVTFHAAKNMKDMIFQPYDVNVPLESNDCIENENKGWNYVGNPYLAYFDISKMSFTSPITVWEGKNYSAYSPLDDWFALKPLQPFFVQCPSNVTNIKFDASGRQAKEKVEISEEDDADEAKLRGIYSAERRLFDIAIFEGDDKEEADRTRVVVNVKATDDYDCVCDAAKMMSMDAAAAQIYTVTRGVKYAINEGVHGNGYVQLGVVAPKAGTYVLKAVRGGKDVKLFDGKTGETVDLSAEGYAFETEEGQNESRFRIVLNGDVNAIENVDVVAESNASEVFSLDGRRLSQAVKGLNVIRKGGKVNKTLNK